MGSIQFLEVNIDVSHLGRVLNQWASVSGIICTGDQDIIMLFRVAEFCE